MSSESLIHDDKNLFLWNGALNSDDYITVSYRIFTSLDPERASIGIAKEQSCSTTRFESAPPFKNIDFSTARVVSISVRRLDADGHVSPYYLNTPVYSTVTATEKIQEIELLIAYPIRMFESGITRIWNMIFGEIPRLGFLRGFRCTDISFPEKLFKQFSGPRFGVSGLREKLNIFDRPLFCRSMRPAVGLTTGEMVNINKRVLSGGFDLVKDDELTYDTERSKFLTRIRKMVAMKKKVEDKTGEKKMYVANIIDDHSRALRYAELAAKEGVDALLVSTHLQGMSIIQEVSDISGLAILSHNTCGDFLTRLPYWGASEELMIKLQRMLGADFVITPGEFSTPYMDDQKTSTVIAACQNGEIPYRAAMPVLQGGKTAAWLSAYIESVGSADFMLTVAAAVDNAAGGQFSGAREFRLAWDRIKNKKTPVEKTN